MVFVIPDVNCHKAKGQIEVFKVGVKHMGVSSNFGSFPSLLLGLGQVISLPSLDFLTWKMGIMTSPRRG